MQTQSIKQRNRLFAAALRAHLRYGDNCWIAHLNEARNLRVYCTQRDGYASSYWRVLAELGAAEAAKKGVIGLRASTIFDGFKALHAKFYGRSDRGSSVDADAALNQTALSQQLEALSQLGVTEDNVAAVRDRMHRASVYGTRANADAALVESLNSAVRRELRPPRPGRRRRRTGPGAAGDDSLGVSGPARASP